MNTKQFLATIWTIARNTYREIIRDRLLYGILAIALLVVASTFFMATISLGQDARVLQNMGIASIHLFSVFIAIFVVANFMNKDLERRALYFLFPKPISRPQYILGKFVGSVLVVATTLGILGGVFVVGIIFTERSVIFPTLINLIYSFLEITFVSAIALLFATFTAPLNAALYSIALYIIGHSLTSLKDFAEKGATAVQWIVNPLYYLLPNLEKFDVRSATLYDVAIPASQVLWTLFYWAIYTAVVLYLAILVMRKREL